MLDYVVALVVVTLAFAAAVLWLGLA